MNQSINQSIHPSIHPSMFFPTTKIVKPFLPPGISHSQTVQAFSAAVKALSGAQVEVAEERPRDGKKPTLAAANVWKWWVWWSLMWIYSMNTHAHFWISPLLTFNQNYSMTTLRISPISARIETRNGRTWGYVTKYDCLGAPENVGLLRIPPRTMSEKKGEWCCKSFPVYFVCDRDIEELIF